MKREETIRRAPAKQARPVAGFDITAGPAGLAIRCFWCCVLTAVVFISPPLARAQTVITTVAGQGVAGVSFVSPTGVAVDAAGNLYVADTTGCVVTKTSNGVTTILAGTTGNCSPDSNSSPATLAYPIDVASCSGNVYFATHGVDNALPGLSGDAAAAGSIYRVDSNGNISALPMPTEQRQSFTLFPVAIACDVQGDVFVSSYFNSGDAGFGSSVDEIPVNGQSSVNFLLNSLLAYPGIAVDSNDNLFVIQSLASRGWLGAASSSSPASGFVEEALGNNAAVPIGPSGILTLPSRLAIAPSGAFDAFYYTQGTSGGAATVFVTTTPANSSSQIGFAGNGTAGFSGDNGGPPTEAELNDPAGIAIDGCGSIYVADAANGRIRKIVNTNSASTAPCTAGSSGPGGSGSEGTTSLSLTVDPGQQVTAPAPLTFNATVTANCPSSSCSFPVTGEVFFCYAAESSGTGCGSGSTIFGAVLLNGPGLNQAVASFTTTFLFPGTYYVAAEYFDLTGNLPPVSTPQTLQILVCGTACIDPGVPIIPTSKSPVAMTPGSIVPGFEQPGVVAFDASGVKYFLYSGGGSVTRFDTVGGTTPILPGGGVTSLNNPSDMVIGADGNLYVTDTGNNRIIQVVGPATATPAVKVIVPLLSASFPTPLNSPTGIFETGSEVYVSDTGNQRVVEFRSDGSFPAVALSQSTPGAPAIGALHGVVVDSTAKIYVANSPAAGSSFANNVIELPFFGGTPTILPTPGVTLQLPFGLAIDASNGLYISDVGAHQIYRSDVSRNIVVVAGNGTATEPNTVGVSATQTGLSSPTWLALDPSNSIWFSDTNSVAKIDVTQAIVNFTAAGQTQTIYLTDPVSGIQGSVGVDLPSPLLLTGPGSGEFTVQPSSTCVSTSPSFPVTTLSPDTSCTIVITYGGVSNATASIAVPAEIEISTGTFNPNAEMLQTINLNGTATAGPIQTFPLLTGFVSPIALGTPVTLIATVGAASGKTGNTGTVTFYDGTGPVASSLCTGPTTSIPLNNGTATVTCTLPQGPLGLHSLSFTYSDPTNTFESNVSPFVQLTILPSVSSVSISPSSVTGGTSTTGTVTLNAEAPAEGLTVSLQSSNSTAATVSSTVTVPGGHLTAPFPITTLTVTASTNVIITASFVYGNTTGSASSTLEVDPAGTQGPVNITVNETITVNDADTLPDIADLENISVTDSVTIIAVNPPINVAAPVAYFSPSNMGFSDQTGGQIIQISNIGSGATANLIINSMPSISGTGSSAFAISQPTCTTVATSFPITLPSDGACTFTITYTAPTSGPASATLTFSDNAALTNCNVAVSCVASASSPYTQAISLNGSGTSSTAPEPPAVITVTDNETITVTDTPAVIAGCGTVAITPAGTLSPAVAGFPYAQSFTASGASGTIAWSLSKAPPWLTINPGTGVLSGTPPHAAAKPFNFTVTAAYGNSCTASVSVSLGVVAASVKIVAASTTITASSSSYTVTVKVMNAGNVPISTLTLSGATLGHAKATLIGPTTISNIAPGATGAFTVQFVASAVRTTAPALTLIGNYSAGSIRGSWKLASQGITLP